MEQIREADPNFQIGPGKAEELARLCKELGADVVIFDNEMKTVQIYNLAKLTGALILDRFQLILEIFLKRASTREAKLQIQLAKLRYEYPRARERVRLARLGEQPGFYGLGKYQVDVYYQAIRRQMHHIKRVLASVRQRRSTLRYHRQRLGFYTVSLAGYTNAGKSTLFNALTSEGVPTNLGLFTTLSTTTRAISIGKRKLLLIDTVGFVDRLPIALVEAFRSTLEETIFADLILLILDLSEPTGEIERKLSTCIQTIQEIGASSVPMVTALNKIDLISPADAEEKKRHLSRFVQKSVLVSSLKMTNIELLLSEIERNLESPVEAAFVLPPSGRVQRSLSLIREMATVLDIEYSNSQISGKLAAYPRIIPKIVAEINGAGGEITLDRQKDLRDVHIMADVPASKTRF
jgi:GTP-binding protein HflX